MKLREIEGWPRKIKGTLSEISRWQGYHDALSEVGEKEIELDMEILGAYLELSRTGVDGEAGTGIYFSDDERHKIAQILNNKLKFMLKVKGKK